MMKTLWDLAPGQTGIVRGLMLNGSMRRRMQDIGMIAGTRVECVGRSPGGDPAAYAVRGAVVAIRSEDGRNVLVEEGRRGAWG